MFRISVMSAGAVLWLAGVSLGQGTPEAAFKDFQAAIKAKDGEKAWGLLAKDSQKMMDDGLTPMKAALKQLDSAPPEAQKAAAEQFNKMFGLTIDELKKLDAKGFFIVIIKNSDKFKGQGGGPDEWAEATLEDVKTEGDKATAKVKTAKKTEPIEFAKEDGAWKVQLPNPKKKPAETKKAE